MSKGEGIYESLIRPHLEYASSVWDLYLAEDILELEKVQRRAARWVVLSLKDPGGCYGFT